MKPWLALIVGIAIGWLIGWLFDKWYRGRRSAQPASAPVAAHPVEIELPRPVALSGAASPEAAPATLLAAEAAAAATSHDERSLEEAEHETPPEVNWEELYAEAQERSGEIGLEPQIDSDEPLELAAAPASLGSELPEAPVALPPETVEALAPTPDDLTVIEGIGPAYAARLNEAGISTYARLAESSPEELAGIIQAPSWRKMYFPEWIEQARLLRDQQHERLLDMQSRLFKRKKE